MGGIKWSELFPSRKSIGIFISYMSLFVGQGKRRRITSYRLTNRFEKCLGIFVTASQDKDNKYKYNTVTLVLLTEVLKLVVSSALYCRE